MINKCSNGVKQTAKIARDFARILKKEGPSTVLLEGPMGAGKTTFTAEVIRNLNKKIAASSPTFTIINHYGGDIYHVDLYRIQDEHELRNTDFYEIVNGENFVFIEWPQRLQTLSKVSSKVFRVIIEITGETGRRITIDETK